jgi:chemotaxis protein methyltransferase CheR
MALFDEVERFRSFVSAGLGLALDDTRAEVLDELLERRSAWRRLPAASYLDELRDPRQACDELRALAPDLTVPETYFYRHEEQLTAFAEVALPDAIASRRDPKRVRILCLGCATGEEPFTLAMMMRSRGIDPGPGSIRAVDVSTAALAKAARGRYGPWALRQTPSEMRSRWFSLVDNEYRVDDSIRPMVTFDQANLASADEAMLALAGPYDVVFCRNMLMYFTREHAAGVIARVTSALTPSGYLFLGHAETLRGLSGDFDLRHSHGAFFYQRRPPNESAGPSGELTTSIPEPSSTGWVETIREASDRVRALTARSLAEAPSRPAATAPAAEIGAVLDLARSERFADALDVLARLPTRDAPDPDRALLRAALLTQNGDIELAEHACRALLELDGLHAGAHYLLALCCEARSDAKAALDHDRMAAYLDPSFAMPRLHLGLSARRVGQLDAARVELGLALELLHREDPARILLFGGGFARDALVALCRAELRACGGRP